LVHFSELKRTPEPLREERNRDNIAGVFVDVLTVILHTDELDKDDDDEEEEEEEEEEKTRDWSAIVLTIATFFFFFFFFFPLSPTSRGGSFPLFLFYSSVVLFRSVVNSFFSFW
tara:strand:- start:577 stop:918 length:342 start_codon:yes stop_codon:yes gene_type:complete